MKLYHHGRMLGEITEPFPDCPWICGDIALSPEAAGYRPFFESMTGEDQTIVPKFGDDLLEPDGWFIEDPGEMRGIDVPAVHGDGTIYWRWR